MNVITVGGPPGSGTSTVCQLIEERTKMEYIYAGQIFRHQAKNLGISLSEFSVLCENDPKFDRSLDDLMLEKATKGNVILEGRMIGPLCSKKKIGSLKIYIDADPTIRAKRVMERDGGTLEEVVEKMSYREESEAQRYLRYYDIDPREKSFYDMIIDSSNLTPEEELDLIMEQIRSGV